VGWLSKLFSGADGAEPKAAEMETLEYNGYQIIPDPMPADGQYRLSARIEKEIDGETKTHLLIRADMIRDRDQAVEAAIHKAKQVIDQQGDTIF